MTLDLTAPIRSAQLRAAGGAPWLWATALYLLALAPLGAQAADATIEQKVQACVACHGPNGQSATPTLPSLAGQTSRYIYEQLRDFAAGRRESATMTPLAKTLSVEDMQALGDYFSAQRPMSSSHVPDPARVAHGESIAANALCTMCHAAALAGQNEVPRVADNSTSTSSRSSRASAAAIAPTTELPCRPSCGE